MCTRACICTHKHNSHPQIRPSPWGNHTPAPSWLKPSDVHRTTGTLPSVSFEWSLPPRIPVSRGQGPLEQVALERWPGERHLSPSAVSPQEGWGGPQPGLVSSRCLSTVSLLSSPTAIISSSHCNQTIQTRGICSGRAHYP